MVRYTLLRILVFFGCLALLWLLGLRSSEMRVVLVVAAALLSMAVSYVVLRPFREDYSRQIAERVEARRAARVQRPTDEQVEDASLDEAADTPDTDPPAASAADNDEFR
jgi:flagellar biosynthesis/type III secretory pathway M-ring protein FliF/YscJ